MHSQARGWMEYFVELELSSESPIQASSPARKINVSFSSVTTFTSIPTSDSLQ
jgi:hypothetical protein